MTSLVVSKIPRVFREFEKPFSRRYRPRRSYVFSSKTSELVGENATISISSPSEHLTYHWVLRKLENCVDTHCVLSAMITRRSRCT